MIHKSLKIWIGEIVHTAKKIKSSEHSTSLYGNYSKSN
jgi:hypothetical protein